MGSDRPGRRVGILSATLGRVPRSYLMPTGQILENAVGHNTGNLAFRHAVDLHVASEKVHVPWDADPRWVREACELLVIPSSNQVNPASDFSRRADFLEAVDLPCLAVGLGAQAPRLGADIRLTAGTLRYVRSLSERSRVVGVRGEYTARTLAGFGVENTVVIGCPSHFINPSPALGAAVQGRILRGGPERLAVTDLEWDPSHEAMNRKLFAWMRQHDGVYVCQSHRDLISLARNRPEEISEDQVDLFRRHLLGGHGRMPGPDPDPLSAAETGRRFKVFFDVDAWLEFLAGVDLSVGVRFHGNLLAVQAGTPGVCVVHDARTQELCATTGLPHVSIEQVMAARDVRDVWISAAFDGHAFDARRAALARTYRDVLREGGVEVGGPLEALTAPARPSSDARGVNAPSTGPFAG